MLKSGYTDAIFALVAIVSSSLLFSCTKEGVLNSRDLEGVITNVQYIYSDNSFVSEEISKSDEEGALAATLQVGGDCEISIGGGEASLQEWCLENGIERSWLRSVVYLTERISSIEILADKDYDESHPAGHNLADIVQVTGKSFSDYLEVVTNGKSIKEMCDKYGLGEYANRYEHQVPYRLLASQINEDTGLLSAIFNLKFLKLPDDPGEYTFKILMYFGEKKVGTQVRFTVTE